MKKFLLATLEYPPFKGGVANYYAGLTQELEKQGQQTIIADKNLLSRYFWPRWLKGYFYLKKIIKQEKPDFLLVGQILPLGTIAYLLRRRVPYILFLHGLDILLSQKSAWKRWLTAKILSQAKLIIANSQYTKQQIEKFKIENYKLKINVVYPCPNNLSPTVSPETKERVWRKYNLNNKKTILTLGRLVERKGQDMVITAMPEILKRVPETIYLIAGEGPGYSKLQKMVASLNLSEFVYFLGVVSEEEKNALLSLCDVFVMPARESQNDAEGFGMVFLEAGLFDKPCVGGESGGVGEAILNGQTGLLVNPLDSADIANALVALLKNYERALELGQAGHARVLKEFTWEKQTKKLIEKL